MKITIVLSDGSRKPAHLPYDGATHVVCSIDCPHGCAPVVVAGIKNLLKISGTGINRTSHDCYFADAVALCCKKRIGTIETKVETIFGIEEDERVMSGPWRVY